MFKMLCLKLLVLINYYRCADTLATKIDPELATRLQNGDKVNVVVSFNNGVKSTLDGVAALRQAGGDHASKVKAVVAALEDNAEKSQADVIHKLSTRSGGAGGFKYFKNYWTSNTVFIKEADQATVNSIAEDPAVARIRVEPIMKLGPQIKMEKSGDMERSERPNKPKWEWNIIKVQAPEAWQELEGKSRDNVVVGVIDSGVRHTHEILKDGFRGDYGWFDPVAGSTEPNDVHGHGSGVTGLLAGTGPLGGVAPGIKWMACRACNPDGDCPFEFVSDCVKFMICPTLPDGSNRDCSKAPRIINHSIGDVHGSEANKDDFLAIRSAGIIPVVGIGNSGPGCATTVAPGELPFVIGVGATTKKDELGGDSGMGPAYDGRTKPDLVAPGVRLITATNESDSSYTYTRGTSYATPHVAGVVALLLVRNPELTYEQAYELLTQNTDHTAVVTLGMTEFCPQHPVDVTPNNFYGFGRLNALKAIQAQTKTLGAVSK